MRNAHGYLKVDGTVERDVIRCCHCQQICDVPPGPMLNFPWCWKCGAPTCQQESCVTGCDPWERQLERAEAKHALARAVGL